MGDFGYAPISGGGKVKGLVFSCPTSDPIAPIPQGYSPDRFGSWTLYCSDHTEWAGVAPRKHGNSSISFDSPFENGLTYPEDEG